MTITVSSGAGFGDLIISSGDPLVVLSGGLALDITVLSGGSVMLSGGGEAEGVTVNSGGVVKGSGELGGEDLIFGSVDGVTLVSAGLGGGELTLLSGGTAHGVTVSHGGIVQIASGGSATGTVIQTGAVETIGYGGAASGDIIEGGGTLFLEGGGTASGVTVQSGGMLYYGGTISSDLTAQGGAVTNAVVLGGVTVSSGAGFALQGATLLGGVTVNVALGAAPYDLTIDKGAVLLGAGELGGANFVAGSISGVTLGGGGIIVLSSGAIASGVTAAPGTVQIDFGASATGTVALDGADVVDYGSANGTVVGFEAFARVYSGGVAFGDIIEGGDELVSSGGRAVSATVVDGGIEYAMASGTLTGTVVGSGGDEIVKSGGVARATTVLSGGKQEVFSSGTAVGTTVSSRGLEMISASGTISGLTVRAGGDLVDNGAVVISGAGTLDGILSGGGTIVKTGAGDLVRSGDGAAFSGVAVISGGTIELASFDALGTGYVEFYEPSTGSAVLQVDAADAPPPDGFFGSVLSNFSGAHDDIDLRSIAFVAGASATTVGSTLVLSDGGNTYTFDLAGSLAGSYPVMSDGHGGTLIDPIPIAAKAIDPKVLAFAHGLAAFAPSDAAIAALVSSTSPTGQTPLLQATASAAAGRL
jgi:autotransporter passenger strand-loop-strand repeat protein